MLTYLALDVRHDVSSRAPSAKAFFIEAPTRFAKGETLDQDNVPNGRTLSSRVGFVSD